MTHSFAIGGGPPEPIPADALWVGSDLVPNEARHRTILEYFSDFRRVRGRLFAFSSREAVAEPVARRCYAVEWGSGRGFKTEVRYVGKPTIDEATFCYWRRAA